MFFIIILFALLVISVSLFINIPWCKSSKTKIMSGILGLVALGMLFKIVVYTPPSELQYQYSYNIYALEDNFTVKGNRYYFEEDDRYYYLTDYKDGKKMYSVSKNNSYIVEKDGVQPKIEVYEEVYTSNKFIKRMYSIMIRQKEYKIIVPSKTLTTDFNIDMKK